MIVNWLQAGTAWNLTTATQGVELLGRLEGVLDPEFTAFRTPRIGDGERYRGSRLTSRRITMRLLVGDGTPGMPWRELDRAFWACMGRDKVGLLEVVLEDATSRWLTCKLDQATGTEQDFDPALTGYQVYLVTLVADDPYWAGPDVTETWTFTPGGENFYGGSGGGGLGPPYYLSASGGFGESMVTNAGDVPAWPRWRVTGPCSGAVLTVDGHNIALPVPIPAFTSRYIDTDPPDVYGDLTESRWDEMTGEQDFWPVPTGATVPITASVTDPAAGCQVTMTITPRYERMW